MKFVPDEAVPLRVGIPSYHPPKTETPSLGSTIAAAGTIANWPYRSWRYLDNRAGVDFDPNHDPLAMIRGTKYESDPGRFAHSRNEQETRAIMAEWDQDEHAMEVLARSGRLGTVAAVGMGLLDPTMFIPVYGVASGIVRGSRALKVGLDVAAASAAGAAIGETAMAVTTPGYGAGDVAVGIGSATLLGGLLGAGAGALLSRAERRTLASALDADRKAWAADIAPGSPGAPQPAAAGAAASDTRTLEMRNMPGTAYVPDITAKLSPPRRVLNSPFVEARRAAVDLVETPYVFRENDKGIATTQGPALDRSVRMEISRSRVALTEAFDAAYTRYRFGGAPETWRQSAANRAARVLDVARTPAGGKADYAQFKAMVDDALRNGDQHPVPEVAEVAKFIRANVLEPWRERAVKAGLLPEDVDVATAHSYMIRVWNKQKLIGERPRAVRVFADWLEGEEAKKATLQSQIADLKGQMDANVQMQDRLQAGRSKDLGARSERNAAAISVLENQNALLRQRLEEAIAAWEGKSAREAKQALKARDAEGPRADGERRIGADAAIDEAVRRILAKERLRDRKEIESLANEIVDRIVGNPDGRLPYDAHTAPRGAGPASEARGPLAARDFMIPDVLVRDFLDTDALNTSEIYLGTMVPDVLLTERFGDVDMAEPFRRLKDEHAAMQMAAKTPAERTKIENQYKSTVADLAAMRDRVRRIYGYSADPRSQFLGRLAQAAGNYDVMTNLGGAALSSLADLAGVQWQAGFNRAFRHAWLPMMKALYNPETRRAVLASRRQLKALGIAAETALSLRASSLHDVTDLYRGTSRLERGIKFAADRFGVVSGLSQWTDFGKLAAGMVSSAEFIDGARALAQGRASAGQIRKLAENGIDGAMAHRIVSALEGQGAADVIDGITIPNTGAWADRGAAEAFEGALARQVDIMIITPGAEKPLVMSNPIGALVLQYKSFVVAANERLLVRSLQTRDGAVLSGLASAVGLGIMAEAIYSWIVGRDLPSKPGDLIKAGVTRAGLLGWYQEANALSEKWWGLDGFSALGATRPDSRYISREKLSAALGPTAGKVEALIKTGASVANLDWSEADTRRMRRMLAGQNLFYIRKALDKVEGGVNSALGVD